MVVLGGGAVSYERGTPVGLLQGTYASVAFQMRGSDDLLPRIPERNSGWNPQGWIMFVPDSHLQTLLIYKLGFD